MNNEPQDQRVVETREAETTTNSVEPVTNRVEKNRSVSKAIQVIWYIIGVIVALLLVRFVLALLGANLDNAFAEFIYVITDPLVAPFRGLLQVGQFQAGVVRVEIETLLAGLVYTLIGWGITAAVRLAKR
jgi:uncharacterized protein YggT (Ycf19 family)